ncbi:RNA-binding domain-containing protein [Meredithblackwellia eburnea MCA 4105]
MKQPRTVYVGNLPSDASVDELLSQVRFGPIDSVKILPEKSCAFISFLDPHTASAFHSDAVMRKVRLHDQDLKIGWGKPSAVPPAIILAVNQTGATRNVYLGNLDEDFTEQSLRDELSRFGPIDQVKIVRDKNIGFVHFLSIATAIKVVQTLASEPEWAGRRVNYGKDRCAYVPKNQHQQQQHNMAAAAMGSIAAAQFGGFGGFGVNGSPDPNAQPGNRTIYLGNIHPDTTIEDICNSIRGGILQQIRYIPEKHICFVTFVDPACALAFYQSATFQGIALHNRRLKIGWGKSSGPTSPGIAMVVQSGGSRNVYIGNIEDFETYTEAKLREDFGEYGDLELVNLLPAKNCAFCNFTNIANAIKAIEGMKSNKDYQNLKISFGKDRCGGAPRQMGRNNNFDYPRGQSHQNSHNNFGTGSPFPDGGYPDGIGLIEFSDDFAEGPGAGALVLDESVAQEEQHNKSF